MEDSRSAAPKAATAPEVAAVVLAAGRSTRMAPVNKLTAPFAGRPLVGHAVEAALASKAAEVVVVTGYQSGAVMTALAGRDLRFVYNPDFATGMASSLKAGISSLSEGVAGAVVLLGDMPQVSAAVVDALIDAFRASSGGRICQPRFDGRPGNPVLLPARLFPAVADLTGDQGAKPLLAAEAQDILGVDVDSAAIHMDVDSAADLTK